MIFYIFLLIFYLYATDTLEIVQILWQHQKCYNIFIWALFLIVVGFGWWFIILFCLITICYIANKNTITTNKYFLKKWKWFAQLHIYVKQNKKRPNGQQASGRWMPLHQLTTIKFCFGIRVEFLLAFQVNTHRFAHQKDKNWLGQSNCRYGYRHFLYSE